MNSKPWVRQVEPARVSLEEIETPEIAAFVAFWESLKGSRFAPSWEDFRLVDLPAEVIPRIVVVDVLRDPLDFLVRFWGTGHVDRKGIDKTGKKVSETRDQRGWRVYDEYAWVVRERKPLASVDTVDLRDYNELLPFTQRVVRLPLSSDGETVDKVVSLAEWDKV